MGEPALPLSILKVLPVAEEDLAKDIARSWPEPPLAELRLSRKLTDWELRVVDQKSDTFVVGVDGKTIEILGVNIENVRGDFKAVQGRIARLEKDGKELEDAQTAALTRARKAAEVVLPGLSRAAAPKDPAAATSSRFSPKGALYLWWRVWRGIIALATMFFAVGLALFLYAACQLQKQGDRWDKLSSAGIGIAFTTAATVVATAAFKGFDSARTRDRERRDFLAEVVATYNSVKNVRRHLIALGLRDLRPREWSPDDIKGLHEWMSRLEEAQLRFEALYRKAYVSEIFGDQPHVVQTLREVESYLNRSVLKRWEDHAADIDKTAAVDALGRLKLRSLLDTKNFRRGMSEPLDSIVEDMQARLFGKSKVRRRVRPLSSIRHRQPSKSPSKGEP